MTNIPVISVDGPSGSGKGTVATRLASRLGFHYLDSGAIYRAFGIAAHKDNASLENFSQLYEIYHKSEIFFDSNIPGKVFLNGKDVSSQVRSELGSDLASRLGQMPEIREILLEGQRAYRKAPGLVADGRDMGTVVFPDANLKIFLTASPTERAKRRYKQLISKGIDAILPNLLRDLNERDRRDAERIASPLKPAKDAMVLDSTNLSIDDVVSQILERFTGVN